MSAVRSIELGELMATRLGTVDPGKFPKEVFDLYSIPAFDRGAPDLIVGSSIGSAKQVVQPNDVLLSRIVPHIRRAWVVRADCGRRIIASGEWIVFRNEKFDSCYLRHVLKSDVFHSQFMRTVSGVGGSLLRARPIAVAKIEIPLPSLEEQRRIAVILDSTDELRKKRRIAIARLEQLEQSLLMNAIGKTSSKTAVLSELTVKITDGVHQRPNYTEAGIPFISVKDITTGHLSFENCRFISLEDHQQFTRRCKAERNDILYTKVGATYGRAAIVDTSREFSLYVSVCLIKPDRTQIDSSFLRAVLSSNIVKQQADRRI